MKTGKFKIVIEAQTVRGARETIRELGKLFSNFLKSEGDQKYSGSHEERTNHLSKSTVEIKEVEDGTRIV